MTATLPNPGIGDRRLAAILVLAVAALLAGLYWLGLRDIPAGWGCGDAEPADNDLAAFRAGAPVIHAACTLTLLGGLLALSRRRMSRRGLRRVGRPALVAGGVCALVAVVAAVFPEPVGVAVLWWALYSAAFTAGIVPLAGLAGLVAGAIVPSDTGHLLTSAGLWVAAAVCVPAHALGVYLQSEGPIIC
jgi:hypothetical protein